MSQGEMELQVEQGPVETPDLYWVAYERKIGAEWRSRTSSTVQVRENPVPERRGNPALQVGLEVLHEVLGPPLEQVRKLAARIAADGDNREVRIMAGCYTKDGWWRPEAGVLVEVVGESPSLHG